ncbi:MAG TPA: sulfatase-like hydrolase/transferase [Flavitalea sp.]|nr:sulfatase-like hydrolase/transferase [Flavitalea sp.]
MKMITNLRRLPYHVLLVPVFFVLHGYVENFGFISGSDALFLALRYCAFAAAVFLLSRLAFKNNRKAALMTTAWIALYLFFGAVFDFIKAHSPIKLLYRYVFLGPLFILLLVALFVYLKKSKREIYQITLFLNLLFLIYILVDLGQAAWMNTRPREYKLAMYNFGSMNKFKIPDSCAKPDIYFLLFDEYASSISLKEKYNFINNLDTFLLARKFSIQKHSTSNYNYTPFSMSSTLNMKFLDWLNVEKGITRDDFLKTNIAIAQNEVISFFGHNGYQIVNYSMFDLVSAPSIIKQEFLPVKTKMITEGTLFSRLYKDFEWVFVEIRHIDNNELFIRKVKEASASKHKLPQFIYAHFYMPHEPFFFDKNGRRKDDETVMAEYKIRSIPAYLEYLQYTNTRIRELIDTILLNTNSSATIILASDHGFRSVTTLPHPKFHFQNLNAIYFPSGKYDKLYDSLSNVNLFRVVLNSLYDQHLPLLKDSTIFLEHAGWLENQKKIAH